MLAKSGTHELAGAFPRWESGPLLVPGPVWTSFDGFKKNGNESLSAMPLHHVGRLQTKHGVFRILHDSDFQRVLGIASDVCRLQDGLRFVVQAAKIAIKHPDEEHIRLLITSASLIAGSPELPQRDGHESFQLKEEESSREACDDIDLGNIPRPKW